MTQLNDHQESVILARIITDDVTDVSLRDELLDHYCCFIEAQLAAGADFETAYQLAFQAITPNGAHEIQEELYSILNFKQIIMKKIIYGSGFIAAFCLSLGCMFKTQHWTGGPSLLFAGCFALLIMALVLFVNSLQHYKAHNKTYNLRVFSGFISALFIAPGFIFKLLRYPGADVMVTVGIAILTFIFLPVLFYQLYKQATLNTQGSSL